jgi:hypothetical protein
MQKTQEKTGKGITGLSFEELKALSIEEQKRVYNLLKIERKNSKIVNFSATYKIGAEALARNSGFTMKEAKKLLEVYWKRNHAILKVEQALDVKIVNGQRWLKNPLSGYWYSLRNEKDRFSTLNQGTAVYVFDVWVMFLRNLGVRIALQYHDEILFNVKLGIEKEVEGLISKAMQQVNDRLKLNVKVGCSVQFGQNYAAVH